MKKLTKRFKKPKLPLDKVYLPLKRGRSTEEKVSDALSNVPRITNETVTEHREEMLSSARKYIYPLQHSKNRVVKISVSLLILLVIVFFTGVTLALYKFQSTSTFIYDVTRIIPFPAAKAGDKWVSYESYLFDLRRNIHYYRTQQQADFSTKDGKAQLKHLKTQAMSQVVQDAYVKQLADKAGVRITDRQVSEQLDMVRGQNRLGNNQRVFRDVLNEFWGWSEADFRRALKQQMLTQAVVTKMDNQTRQKAESTLDQIRKGGDFAAIAGQVSDDQQTKVTGGQYPGPISTSNRDVPPAVTAAIFKLQPNQVSDVIDSGYSLEIVKVLERQGSTAKAAHIQFNLRGVDTFVKPLQKASPSRQYIRF